MEDTHILTAENILNQVQFTMELRSGHLFVNFSSFTLSNFVPFAVNDDVWYTVVLNNTFKVVQPSARLNSSPLICLLIIFWTLITGQNCTLWPSYVMALSEFLFKTLLKIPEISSQFTSTLSSDAYENRKLLDIFF